MRKIKSVTAAYHREWYSRNKDKRRLQVWRCTQLRRKNARKFVAEYLSEHPCVDCGESDIVVLEFDHVTGKKVDGIARLMDSSGIPAVKKEISKCQVVCANCHRRRTSARGNHWREKFSARLG